MPYDKSVFDRAHQILSARRRAAVDIQAKNRQQAFAAIPRLRQIDAELRTMGSRIAKAVLTQGGDSHQLLEGLRLRGVSLSEERAQLLRQNGLPGLPGHRLPAQRAALPLPDRAAAGGGGPAHQRHLVDEALYL